MVVQNKNPRTKNLKLRNPITDYSAQVLVRGRQNGFIPLMIMLIVILAAIVWFVFIRVHKAQS